MSSIEVIMPETKAEVIPINTREIYLRAMAEAAQKGQDLLQPLDVILAHRRDADTFKRLANAQTTDEMRLEKFGTPLPEGHPVAPKDNEVFEDQ
ncbi:MAG TPA: hypothetical protein VIM31_03295 [Candidatus Microsaccharimonas sp.]|jgi:hypothetical protein